MEPNREVLGGLGFEVIVRNNFGIKLGDRSINLKIDSSKIANYIQARIDEEKIKPRGNNKLMIFPDLDSDQRYLNGVEVPNNLLERLPMLGGFYNTFIKDGQPFIFLNTKGIWNLLSTKNDNELQEILCKTLIHEIEHYVIDCDPDLSIVQKQLAATSNFINFTVKSATILSGFVIGAYSIHDQKKNNRKEHSIGRRQFLGLSGAAIGTAVSTFMTRLPASFIGTLSQGVFDRFISIHKRAYDIEDHWERLKNAIQIEESS